jgi:hypothetical protein
VLNGFNSPENKALSRCLVFSDKILPLLNLLMNFLVSSVCLKPKLDPAIVFILRIGL